MLGRGRRVDSWGWPPAKMTLCTPWTNSSLGSPLEPTNWRLKSGATVATFSSFGPFVALANLGSTLQGTLAAGRRVIAILDEEPQVAEVPDGEGSHPGFDGAAAGLGGIVWEAGGVILLEREAAIAAARAAGLFLWARA